ncbi:MAG: HAMP domain-containing protein, partial [Nitrospinales bacterium]
MLIYFSGFLLFLSAFNFLYYPYILEKYAIEAMDAKVKRLADMLALGVGTALDSQNFNAVNATLKFAKEDPEFAFAVVFDEDNDELVRVNPFKLEFPLQNFLEKKGRIKLKDHLFYVSPIVAGGNDYGHLILGISFDRLRSTLAQNRWTTFGVCSGILLIGFLFTTALSKSIIRPLNNLAHVVNDMIQGKMEQDQVPVESADEVGKLAQAFNNFLEQIKCFVAQAREMAAGQLDVQKVHALMAEGRDFDQAAGFVKEEYEITKGPLREAFEDLTKQMRKLAVQADAIAKDDLGNPILKEKVPGDLGETFERMVEKMNSLAQQAEIIARNDLYNDRLKDEETGTLGESMAIMVKNLRIHISKMAQTDSLMQQLPTLVMYADNQLNLRYLNPASRKFLEGFKTHLPFPVDQLIGQSIDIFHKDHVSVRKILMDPKNLPHRAQLNLGEETIELEAHPLFDDKGDYLGPMVTWSLITEKVLMMDKEKSQNDIMKGVMAQIRENAHTLASASEEFAAISKQMVTNS